MKKYFIEFCQVILLYTCTMMTSSADTLSQKIVRDGDVVNYGASISDAAFKRLNSMYKDKPFKVLNITSTGGSFDAGMKIANLVYQKNIQVYVPKYCASACTFVFFGAKLDRRDIAPTAMLGLHNVSFDTKAINLDKTMTVRETMQFAQEASVRSAMMISFYSANGVPGDVLLRVSQVYGNNVINIQRDDLITWGSIEEK